MIIEAKSINSYYGKIQALFDVSFCLNDGEVISFIGANGAGKSMLMQSIVGLVKVGSGNIIFNGEDITNMPTHKIIKKGVVYVPEGRRIFPDLTVEENMIIGAHSRNDSSKKQKEEMEEIYDMFPRLKERIKQKGGSLSGGEQQMLAIARGLMAAPKLLMLDEPSMGLAPIIVEEMFELIAGISRKKKLPIMLVEQNAYMAFSISDRAYVLENGNVTFSGTSEELISSDEIRKSYLGSI